MLDETVVYQLMECINQLKSEIVNLKEEITQLKIVVRDKEFNP